MFKYELNFGDDSRDVYVDSKCGNGASVTLQELRGYASEFKTHCVILKKPYNRPHFLNWMNKYYPSYKIRSDIESSGRIDF